jgi:hypothetical protein
MIKPILIATAIIFAAPAFAQSADAAPAVSTAEYVKEGRTVRDANNARLGKIDRVNPDGSVRIIFYQPALMLTRRGGFPRG